VRELLFDFGFGLRDHCGPCVSCQRHALCLNEGHVVNAKEAEDGPQVWLLMVVAGVPCHPAANCRGQ
jgi:hypothetical protein